MINEAIDFYDDPTGSVLKSKLPDHGSIPEFIKTAERLTPEEMNKLPDDVFALVAFDGVNKMRKFACVDKGNVALSVIYFMENKDKMPWEAQKTAAVNLTRACDWYGLEPPKEMEKLALAGALMGVAGLGMGVAQGHGAYKRRKQAMQQGMRPSQAMTKVQELYGSHQMPVSAPGEKTAVTRHFGAQKKPGDPVGHSNSLRDIKNQAGQLGLKNPKVVPWDGGPNNRVAVATDMSSDGWDAVRPEEASSFGGKKPKYLLDASHNRIFRQKTASLEPYVDITGQAPPVKVAHETGQRFCLNGRYPIDTAEQVEKAASYFECYGERFSPFERHQYCVKLAARAGDLGMTLSQEIQRYGSTKTAQDAHVGVYRRQRLFREGTSEHSLLDEMKEKCASIRPEVMAQVLENFDRTVGLDQMWGAEIPDPYFTVFGPEKRAEWSFSHGNDYINEERLSRCAREMKGELKEYFGEDLVDEFARDPQQIFDSLPLDHKRIIMRISQAVEE